jgi:hypothetical protein
VKFALLLIISACSLNTPKLSVGDKVRFDVPEQYWKSCLPIGYIHKITHTVTGKVVYVIGTVKTYYYRDCPNELSLFEKNVRLYDSILKDGLTIEHN